jgi:membrane-associated phospholipid phosphatase
MPVIAFATILGTVPFYRDKLFNYSISPEGIRAWQDFLSDDVMKVYSIVTKFGGGKEQIVLMMVGLILCRRERFFYYASAYTLDKALISLLKLTYGSPRPYMVNPDIQPYHCSKEFGEPSGHSSAAIQIAIVVYLDLFHGATYLYKSNDVPDVRFHHSFVQVLVGILCLLWGTFIPFSRYLVGVHSVD